MEKGRKNGTSLAAYPTLTIRVTLPPCSGSRDL
jgi:hypothetical protein